MATQNTKQPDPQPTPQRTPENTPVPGAGSWRWDEAAQCWQPQDPTPTPII